MQKLKDWYYSLKPRERMMISGGGILVALVAVYMLGLGPFYSAVKSRGERVATKEGDLAWMRSVAGEVRALGASAAAAPAPTNESLVVLIDRTARECGIGQALSGQTPAGENSIRVRLENAEFDKLLVCLTNLQQVHALSIDQASIDRTGKPGFVNVGLTLTRAGG